MATQFSVHSAAVIVQVLMGMRMLLLLVIASDARAASARDVNASLTVTHCMLIDSQRTC